MSMIEPGRRSARVRRSRRVSCRPRKERFCSISKRRSITASTPWGC